ncbi:hypothetical protein OEZ86_004766 [Tetradesmus obliquus]|nr:hypothetical protein OEZ86_004766 [Tetradesmus obliquus]
MQLASSSFEGAAEQSYVSWKHASLLHLDYGAALFGLLYLAVVLRRLLQEPSALFYFCIILVKVLPHAPLVLGFRRQFLRHRETWLLLIAPCMALITLLMSLPALSQGSPALLLPNRAYRAYWASRGELQTGMLRPFLQHMRLRPYLVYTLIDAALTAWVFVQVFGVWAAVARMVVAAGMSVGICWGFDLHMRRRFIAAMARRQQRQLLQQQQ